MQPSQDNNTEPLEAESLETAPASPSSETSSTTDTTEVGLSTPPDELPLATPPDIAPSPEPTSSPTTSTPHKLAQRFKTWIKSFNIYMALFLLLVVASVVGTLAIIWHNQQDSSQAPISTQSLTEESLAQLRNSDVKVGDPKQVLTVESHAIFAGQVLIRDNLDVAGTLKVGGPLSLPGLTVAGTTALDQLQMNGFTVAGDGSIQGNLNIQNGLNVAGGASFGGPISAPQLNIERLQLNQDLQINRHISTGGGVPGHSNGNALGGGGTSSISGSDTAGTVTINIGNNPPAGCFVTVNFVNGFSSTPHVVITPVGSAAASLSYYINRSAANFSICSINAASPGQSFSFDYIVIN